MRYALRSSTSVDGQVPSYVAQQQTVSDRGILGNFFNLSTVVNERNNPMTTQDQEFTNSPEATPPAARSAESPPAKRRPFSMRGFTSLLLTLSFLVMVVAGIMLFLTPRGRVANWTDWTLLGLGKEQWGAVHIMNSILFVIIAGLHLYLNWSVFLGYLRKKAVAGLHMKRELAVATAVAILLVVGAIASVPPFSSIMALNDDIKDYWEVRAAQAPVPHAEQLTLVEFAGHINLSLDELTEALQEEGFTVGNSELTVGEVGRQKGVAPVQDMIHQPANCNSRGSWHPITLPHPHPDVN